VVLGQRRPVAQFAGLSQECGIRIGDGLASDQLAQVVLEEQRAILALPVANGNRQPELGAAGAHRRLQQAIAVFHTQRHQGGEETAVDHAAARRLEHGGDLRRYARIEADGQEGVAPGLGVDRDRSAVLVGFQPVGPVEPLHACPVHPDPALQRPR